MNLQGERVVIIGGSSGIGLATAKAAVSAGAKVIIAGRSVQKLKQAQVEIGGDVEISSLDLLHEDAVKKFFAEVGIIDHLVIPGSSVKTGAFRELETSDARESLDSNFGELILLPNMPK
jgi:NAD(P)-dependent dehydrogenase (short-subunit alcohol dehydrogenase family)